LWGVCVWGLVLDWQGGPAAIGRWSAGV
jgi:hypothetical protein